VHQNGSLRESLSLVLLVKFGMQVRSSGNDRGFETLQLCASVLIYSGRVRVNHHSRLGVQASMVSHAALVEAHDEWQATDRRYLGEATVALMTA
jgi:hypothetical protein